MDPVKIDLSGEARLGGGFSAPDLGHFAPGTPAFWSLIVLALLIVAIVAVSKGLR